MRDSNDIKPASERPPETTPSVREHLIGRSKVLIIQAFSALTDGLWIAAWVVVNWFVETRIVEPMRLNGVDAKLLTVIQYVVGIGTLAMVGTFVLEDMITLVGGAARRVRRRWRDRDR